VTYKPPMVSDEHSTVELDCLASIVGTSNSPVN